MVATARTESPENESPPLHELLVGPGTRARILRGTALSISQVGSTATVQDILLAAKVSRRTFYQFFDSKDQALDTLFAGATNFLVQMIENAVASAGQGEAQLAAAVNAYLSMQQAGGPLVIALHSEAKRSESRLANRREQTLDRLVTVFDRAVVSELGIHHDPLIFRGLLIGLEGLVFHLGRDGGLTREHSAQIRSSYLPMMMRALSVEC